MLKSISLKNFKCFKQQKFPLAKLNLLTGINGKGKSTLLQSLLLMRQTLEYNENNDFFILNGNCIQLGTFNDLRNSEVSKSEAIEMVFNFENAEKNVGLELKYILEEDGKDDSRALVNEINIKSNWYFWNRKEFTSKTIEIKQEQQRYKEHFILNFCIRKE